MRNLRVILGVLALFALFVPVLPAHAQNSAPAPKPDIESVLTAKKVELNADKKEVLSDARAVKPGEVIEYQVAYSNKSKTAVRPRRHVADPCGHRVRAQQRQAGHRPRLFG